MLAGELGRGFLQSRDPWGAQWLPLARPRRPVPPRNPGSRPLIDTGALLASVVSTGEGHIEQVEETEAEFGTRVKYASVHQTGTIKTNRIPARPFMGVSEEMADALAEAVADELVKQMLES